MVHVHGPHGGPTTAGTLSFLAWEPDLSAALPLRIMPHNAQLIDVDLALCSARELKLHEFHGSMVNSICLPLPHSCSSPQPLSLQHSCTLMSLLFSSRELIRLSNITYRNVLFILLCVQVLKYNLLYILSSCLLVGFLCFSVGLCMPVPVWTHMKKQQVSRKTESWFPC